MGIAEEDNYHGKNIRGHSSWELRKNTSIEGIAEKEVLAEIAKEDNHRRKYRRGHPPWEF